MRVEELRPLPLFEGLSDSQLQQLVDVGSDVPVEPGVELFVEGDHADAWWVLVEGVIELVRRVGREDAVVGRMDRPGLWAGGFRAWDEHGVYLATGRGLVAGRVLRVPAPALAALVGAWLPLAGHLVRGLYGTARSIEEAARQRQAHVALGTLSAGLAHELNNPAAAASRAVQSLAETTEVLLGSLRRLAEDEITAQQFAALDQLRLEVSAGAATTDPLAVAEQEEQLEDWLVEHGVADGWRLSGPLAAAGVDVGWCGRAADVLEGSGLEAGLQWVQSTLAAGALLAEIREATKRISDLVAAVRTYSQMDRATLQPVDVREGLESTLVMLGDKLRPGVTVVRDLAPELPRIEASAGELNQVWTNLVVNAVDAMEGSGRLRVSARGEDDAVVVEIADTGPGMPPEVAARAFEAFFTTKEVGRGTGLGLDIARRVVERHGGTITALTAREESDRVHPGEGTVMQVRLPHRTR